MMTNTRNKGIMSEMPIRPRIQIDMSQQLSFALDALAGQETVKQGRRVTKREIVLAGLLAAYPELKPLVLAELGQSDDDGQSLLQQLSKPY